MICGLRDAVHLSARATDDHRDELPRVGKKIRPDPVTEQSNSV